MLWISGTAQHSAGSTECCNTARQPRPTFVHTTAVCKAANSRDALIWCFVTLKSTSRRRYVSRHSYSSFLYKPIIRSCLLPLWVLQPAVVATPHKLRSFREGWDTHYEGDEDPHGCRRAQKLGRSHNRWGQEGVGLLDGSSSVWVVIWQQW